MSSSFLGERLYSSEEYPSIIFQKTPFGGTGMPAARLCLPAALDEGQYIDVVGVSAAFCGAWLAAARGGAPPLGLTCLDLLSRNIVFNIFLDPAGLPQAIMFRAYVDRALELSGSVCRITESEGCKLSLNSTRRREPFARMVRSW